MNDSNDSKSQREHSTAVKPIVDICHITEKEMTAEDMFYENDNIKQQGEDAKRAMVSDSVGNPQTIKDHVKKIRDINEDLINTQQVWDEFNPGDGETVTKKVKTIKAPEQPSIREREEHEITHMPYRTWCDACVKGKAVTPHHRKLPEEHKSIQGGIPRISMDYLFMGQQPYLIIKDSCTKCVHGLSVSNKGTTSPGVIKRVCEVIDDLCYNHFILSTDQEAAIKDLTVEARSRRQDDLSSICDQLGEARKTRCQIIRKCPGVGDSASNGDIEEAIRRVQSMARTL